MGRIAVRDGSNRGSRWVDNGSRWVDVGSKWVDIGSKLVGEIQVNIRQSRMDGSIVVRNGSIRGSLMGRLAVRDGSKRGSRWVESRFTGSVRTSR